jgi:molybdopterin synthase catalytic subunit
MNMPLSPQNGSQWAHIADRAEAALDPMQAIEFVSDPAFGGVDVFIGRVRDFNQGRTVVGVSYEVFDALALNRFGQIMAEVAATFGPKIKLYVAHAKGRLDIGDIAVIVAAGTPHRDEAFRACRQVIEAVKHTSPIWKQEHYQDGDSVWSEGCSLCGPEAPEAESHASHGHVKAMQSMKSIDLLYEDLQNAPSLLSVGDEVCFILGVMAFGPDDIARNSEVFFKILDQIEDSHTEGWGHISEDPEAVKIFERFASFLEGLVLHIPDQEEWLDSAAKNFRLR